MRRREKFIVSSFLLSFGLFATQYIPLDFRILGIVLFFFLTYGISAWALLEDLNGIEWFTIIPFPALYAISVALFYFLLPENIWSRIAILVLFGVGMYALYLTANIYSVAKLRTIQLLRAAHAIGLLFALFILFLLSNTVFSYHLPFWANGLGIGLLSVPLALVTLWSIELKSRFSREVIAGTVVVSTLLGEVGIVLSFLPATLWMRSLYVVSVFYVCLCTLTTKLSGRLFHNTIWEYSGVWIVMTALFWALLPWK